MFTLTCDLVDPDVDADILCHSCLLVMDRPVVVLPCE